MPLKNPNQIESQNYLPDDILSYLSQNHIFLIFKKYIKNWDISHVDDARNYLLENSNLINELFSDIIIFPQILNDIITYYTAEHILFSNWWTDTNQEQEYKKLFKYIHWLTWLKSIKSSWFIKNSTDETSWIVSWILA